MAVGREHQFQIMNLPEHLRRYDFSQEHACGEPIRIILGSRTSDLTHVSGYGRGMFMRLARDFTPVVIHNKAIAREKDQLSVIEQSATNMSHPDLAVRSQRPSMRKFV